ncbi:MAG: tRNA (adenosine(37)-N6)-threonylcarbamoyltransferase complex dimerization subunit type 1 TsaB [Bdellovibrionia bacterium]
MPPYILNIHTATETALVNLSKGPEVLGTKVNTETKEHASFLHPAINDLLMRERVSITEIKAIGITLGPGSYTGMRVGLAAAKGICYALNIPLVTFSSLELIAASCAQFVKEKEALYCPMIDARRMEVYTALYSYKLDEITTARAEILSKESFSEELARHNIYFCGSGSAKFQTLSQLPEKHFPRTEISSMMLSSLSWSKIENKKFEKSTDAQPLYMKGLF